ncbi:predicted protein [Nematostella vectensis]|uniref:Uncharacterized protein n=1 Tax=Nematostella vectensis TaxID=45351 RepID=A8DW68_NEMVE|nr:predicted protein [Nematostella vectensis]|eukprot:XP_001617641.1 hypothetical protein NEMVEDRAFT_v1g225920 [Nematostella vectensis]
MAAHVINEPTTTAGIAPAVTAFESGKLDGLKKYHGDKTASLFYAWANTWRDQSFEHWNITHEITNDVTKGLFIQGADDQYGTEKQLALIGECVQKSTVQLLENCGHHPHLEQTASSVSLVNLQEKNYLYLMSEEFTNPIDPDHITETPHSLEYPHHAGSALVKPEDQGKLKGRAISAMEHQTDMQLKQIYDQMQLLSDQEDRAFLLSLIAPDQWGRSKKSFEFVATVRLLADHTWDIIQKNEDFEF